MGFQSLRHFGVTAVRRQRPRTFLTSDTEGCQTFLTSETEKSSGLFCELAPPPGGVVRELISLRHPGVGVLAGRRLSGPQQIRCANAIKKALAGRPATYAVSALASFFSFSFFHASVFRPR